MSLKRPLSLPFDPIFLAILVAAAFLLFFRLDHRPFWQDEAETACLARNVLKYGVPKAFDGVNLISQEQGREFDADYLWRWSPWLQIYVAAGAFQMGGLTTTAGRFPFALAGLACIWLVYLLAKRRFGDLTWARLAAGLLASTVLFLLFSRQCRYYSIGALLALVILYAFRGDWQSRFGPAALLVGSLVLLFHTNYLLFFSYAVPLLVASVLLYRRELPLRRTLILALVTALLVIPSLKLYRFGQQAGMMDFTLVPNNLGLYFTDLFQFMLPLPVAAGLLWRWRNFFLGRAGPPDEPEERFTLFLGLIILGNIAIMALVPQRFFRYVFHLYPLCALILAWVIRQVWRYHKFSGILLALLLVLTNFLHLVPMGWLGIVNRPDHNHIFMLTYPNIPLKLLVTELGYGYPDTNRSLIQFFKTQARPGETILATYGDLPLQFYTSYRVLGGLQGSISPRESPDWVAKRRITRLNRQGLFLEAEEFIRHHLRLKEDYRQEVLPYPDERFGNIPEPGYHRFLAPGEPFPHLTIHRQGPEVP